MLYATACNRLGASARLSTRLEIPGSEGGTTLGLRLSFGIGPLRASVPLISSRRRSRRKTYHAIAAFADGSDYRCHHKYQTEQAAIACAQKYRRDRAAEKSVPPLTKKPKHRLQAWIR